MTTGFLIGGESVQVKTGLTNAKEVRSLPETNQNSFVAIEIELGLLADHGGQTWPGLHLPGNTAGF